MRTFVITLSFLMLALSANAQTSSKSQDVATEQEAESAKETILQPAAPDVSENYVAEEVSAGKQEKHVRKSDDGSYRFSLFGLVVSDWIALGLGVAALLISLKSLRQNRISNEKQNRAYIGIESIKSKPLTEKRMDGLELPVLIPSKKPMYVILTIRNAGQTPAKNVKIVFDQVFGNTKIKDEMPKPKKGKVIGSMMPNSEAYLEAIQKGFDGEDWKVTQQLLMDGSTAYHIYGVIYYDDGYGGNRETHFHAYLTKQPIHGSSLEIGKPERNFMT